MTASVPWEAFDDTHADHAEFVERNGRLFCADDCALHPLPCPHGNTSTAHCVECFMSASGDSSS